MVGRTIERGGRIAPRRSGNMGIMGMRIPMSQGPPGDEDGAVGRSYDAATCEACDAEETIWLHVEPRQPPRQWQEFVKETVSGSVALDGYVSGVPMFLRQGSVHANFNHHEGVARLETRATCAQVLMALRQGFMQATGTPLHLYVNDCDEDVCLSVYLLQQHMATCQVVNPRLNKLVGAVDYLDTTAGAYPYPADSLILSELAWVFQPYREFRLNGGLDRRQSEEFREIIGDVGHRIDEYLAGIGSTIDIDARYRVKAQVAGWSFVEEIGAQARTGMFADGIRAFVSLRQRADGRWHYTVGRMSHFIDADIPLLIQELNRLECCGSGDTWGGSETIAGSPRIAGSALAPEEVMKVVEWLRAGKPVVENVVINSQGR